MCFDKPKVVRSPGCDHGHDEESRNGRDIKIDIRMTMFGHRKGLERVRAYTGVPGGYRNPPGSIWALMGFSGERERGSQGRPRAPSPSGPNWTRKGGRGPPFPLPLPHFPSPSLFLVGLGKGSPTPTRRWTPPLSLVRPKAASLPLAPFPSFPLRPNKAHIPPGGF